LARQLLLRMKLERLKAARSSRLWGELVAGLRRSQQKGETAEDYEGGYGPDGYVAINRRHAAPFIGLALRRHLRG